MFVTHLRGMYVCDSSERYVCLCGFIPMLLIFYSADSAIEPRYTLARDPVEGEVPEHLVLEIKLPGMVKIGGRRGRGGGIPLSIAHGQFNTISLCYRSRLGTFLWRWERTECCSRQDLTITCWMWTFHFK